MQKKDVPDDVPLDKRRKIAAGRLLAPAAGARGRQPFVDVNNRQGVSANDACSTEDSDCGAVEFTKEEIDALLSEKLKGKKFDLKVDD